MLKTPIFYLSAVLAIVILFAAHGCVGKSQPTRFYTLTSLPERSNPSEAKAPFYDAAIGIGPIKLPDYLNQPGIITRLGDNSIEMAQFDNWTGSFVDNLTNVLAENMGNLLTTDRVFIYPWKSYIPIDYQVTVDIIRFDGRLAQEAVLIARWIISNGEDKKIFAMKRSDIREPVANGGYEAFVAAQSRALAKLSREIIEAIEAAYSEKQFIK